MKERVQKGLVRSYLAYKRVLSDIKGSPTMEYIVIIAVGALFAGILYNVFSGDNAEGIMKKIKKFVEEQIDNTLNGNSDNSGNEGN